jgi:putative transposase
MILAHKIQLNPTPEQGVYFKKASGTVRFTYNWGLARWKELYEAGQKTNALSLKKEFNAIKHQEFPWVGEVSGRCTEYGFACLGNAFANFFRRVKNGEERAGHPKFKAKHRSKPSFYIANSEIKLCDHGVFVPRCGWVNMAENLRFEGKINSAVVSQSGGRWWIAITVEVPDREVATEGEAVGIDLGVKEMAVLSDGRAFANPKHLRSQLRKLRQLNKKLARQQQGSNAWMGTKAKLTRLHYRIRCRRQDAIHKLTTAVAKEYGLIGLETLNVQGMMSNGRLAQAVGEVGFYEIKRQLQYKCKLYGAHLVEVDQWFPSSRLCSDCGWKNEGLTLSDREWVCLDCGCIHERDVNAAVNIRDEAIRLYDNLSP